MEFTDYQDSKEKLNRQVFIADDHIVINVYYEYNISLDRCDSAEKLLHWVWHLTEKTWMTNDVMRRFISLACQKNGINMKEH